MCSVLAATVSLSDSTLSKPVALHLTLQRFGIGSVKKYGSAKTTSSCSSVFSKASDLYLVGAGFESLLGHSVLTEVFTNFPQSFQEMLGDYFELEHNCFLTHSFQFVFH